MSDGWYCRECGVFSAPIQPEPLPAAVADLITRIEGELTADLRRQGVITEGMSVQHVATPPPEVVTCPCGRATPLPPSWRRNPVRTYDDRTDRANLLAFARDQLALARRWRLAGYPPNLVADILASAGTNRYLATWINWTD